jgi:hypothetical protein
MIAEHLSRGILMRGRLPVILTIALLAASLPARATAAEAPWTPVTPALGLPEGLKSAGLFDVAAVSPADVWAVGGGRSDTAQTLIEHWTGTGWQRVPEPSVPNFQYDLWAVDAVSAGDVWAVGDGSTPEAWPFSTAVIAHYDGTAWSLVPAPAPPSNPDVFATSDVLFDVGMLSATDGWAVGWHTAWFDTGETTVRPLVLRWQNGQWVRMSLPDIDDGMLEHVYARAANDVWAVGSSWDSPLVMHFDGTRWSRVEVPGSGVAGAWNKLRAVTAVSANEVWAVGDACVSLDGASACQPLILRLSGGVWRVVPKSGDRGTNLVSVVARSSDDVWMVGYDIPPGGQEANYVEHWDGQRLVRVPAVAGSTRGDLASALGAVTRIPGTAELWAVGWQAGHPQVIRHD